MQKLLFVGAIGLAFLAVGCRHHRAPQDAAQRAVWLQEKLAKRLDLDAEQKAKALPILQAMVSEREGWRGEGARLLDDLKVQVAAESFDQGALNKALAEREAHLAKSRQALVGDLGALHALLKPEQRKKAAEALGKLEDRVQKWGSRS